MNHFLIYLIAIGTGIYLLIRGRGKLHRLTGSAALVLGLGDAFHLVPRVLAYFSQKDLTAALGFGKLVTSLTMTVFYILVYYIFIKEYGAEQNKVITSFVWGLSAMRIALCLFPQNAWFGGNSPLMWGIVRNIPFVILGAIVVCLYFGKRKDEKVFGKMWIYIALSFLFYIPVVVGAGAVPLLGMLMLPKTVCYVLILIAFLKKENSLS